jgi:hypothetical protein
MYGLMTKILSRDDDEFPGGYHYHNRKPYMRQYLKKQNDPYKREYERIHAFCCSQISSNFMFT